MYALYSSYGFSQHDIAVLFVAGFGSSMVFGTFVGALADKLDVSRQTVISIENGKYDPSLPLAFRIARVFGLPIETIFDDENAG